VPSHLPSRHHEGFTQKSYRRNSDSRASRHTLGCSRPERVITIRLLHLSNSYQSIIAIPWCKTELTVTVTPGISALEYATRRAKLASGLPDGAVAVVPASYVKYRSGPVFYPFHQNPDFLYLTGFLEPEALCVIGMYGGVVLSFVVVVEEMLIRRRKDGAGWEWRTYVSSVCSGERRPC